MRQRKKERKENAKILTCLASPLVNWNKHVKFNFKHDFDCNICLNLFRFTVAVGRLSLVFCSQGTRN